MVGEEMAVRGAGRGPVGNALLPPSGDALLLPPSDGAPLRPRHPHMRTPANICLPLLAPPCSFVAMSGAAALPEILGLPTRVAMVRTASDISGHL